MIQEQEYASTTTASLLIGLDRLMDESIWSRAVRFDCSNDISYFEKQIDSLSGEAEFSLATFAMMHKTIDFGDIHLYTPKVLKQNSMWTYDTISALIKKKIIEEASLDTSAEYVCREMIDSLTRDEICELITEIQKSNCGSQEEINLNSVHTMDREELASLLLKKVKSIKGVDFPNKTGLSFISPKGCPSSRLSDICDTFCMLYGGEFACIPHPSELISCPEQWERPVYRNTRVLECLASGPSLEWSAAGNETIAYDLFIWDLGHDWALDFYRIAWNAYVRLAGRGKVAPRGEEKYLYDNRKKEGWVKYRYDSVKDLLKDRYLDREAVEDQMSKEVKRYMGNKLDIYYWAMQALHALAQCAMHEEEFNLAIKMYKLIEKYAHETPSVQKQTEYNRILCHLEIKEWKIAFTRLKKVLSNAYSYAEPFVHVCDFMGFHLSNEKKKFLRLGERIALERLMQNVHVKLPWSEFKPIKLLEAPVKTRTSQLSRKRASSTNDPRTAEEFVLSHYVEELGSLWTGSACKGKILAAVLFVLMADIFQPDPKSKIAQYLFPSRWREVPLDFGTPQFIQLRDYQIEKALESIEEKSADEIGVWIVRQYEVYKEKRFGRLFREYDVAILTSLAKALVSQNVLMPLLQFFLLEGTLKGVPSVWLWTEKGSQDTLDVNCVLVKAIGESLTDDERAWIHVLCTVGVFVEVCMIEKNQNDIKETNEEDIKQKKTGMGFAEGDVAISESLVGYASSTSTDSYDL